MTTNKPTTANQAAPVLSKTNMAYAPIDPIYYKDRADELRMRFWKIHQQHPASLSSYAKRAKVGLSTFYDFMFGRRMLQRATFRKVEIMIQEVEAQ
jgi:hypothetical protein